MGNTAGQIGHRVLSMGGDDLLFERFGPLRNLKRHRNLGQKMRDQIRLVTTEDPAMRRRDPEDRRRHLVAISDKGVAVLDEVARVMDAVEDELLAGLDPAERAGLEDVLTSIWESSGDYDAWAKVAAEA